MKIQPTEVSVRELVNGYHDDGDGGVVGYGGLLDVRPPYQREFVYKDKQRAAVIDTVTQGFPLNVMYWSARDDGGFEIIDGQQRTISLAQYVTGVFSYKGRYFHNLQQDEQDVILNYKLTIYRCSGTDSEKLKWFRIINIAGERLYEQELRNAVYSGSWVTDAKRYFSRTSGPAYMVGGEYMSGTPIRQDYLETVLKWLSGGRIEEYMAEHQHDANANAEWLYFQAVIAWVKATFPTYRREMKGLPWGELYNEYSGAQWNPAELEAQIVELLADEDVTKKSGVYKYVLSGDERALHIRQFTAGQRREAYERQQGICPVCRKYFHFEAMEADHITPWSAGGHTTADNCQMLCRDDNRRKSNV